MNYKNYKLLGNKVSFLILDYQKPVESEILLQSIARNVQFPEYEVVFFSNGGEQDYAYEFYKRKLIDRLILNFHNEGCGFGTMHLVQQCTTKYFFYLQNDCFLCQALTEEMLNGMIKMFEGDVGAIDLKGTYKDGRFSESAFFAETEFYLSNPNLEGGGPGKYQTLSNTGKLIPTEHAMSEWLVKNNKKVAIFNPVLCWNMGKYTIRETACGGVILFRCDSQQLWIVKPLKRRHEDMKYTDEEWEKILTGKWIGGTVPEYNKNQVFTFFGPPDEIGKPPEQYARFFAN